MTSLNKKQLFLYRLLQIARQNKSWFKSKKKTYTLRELSKEIDGNNFSGYVREFLECMVNEKMIVFETEEEKNGRFWKVYSLDYHAIADHIVDTEWYKLTRELVEELHPRLM